MRPLIQPAPENLVLDPDYGRTVVETYFRSQLDVARDVRDYGALLLLRTFEGSDRKLKDVVLLVVLLRQILATFDGVVLCLENGAAYAADMPLRALLESNLVLERLLLNGSETEFGAFYVSVLRSERSWWKNLIAGTPERRLARDLSLQAGREELVQREPELAGAAKERVQQITTFLRRKRYRAINAKFHKHQKARNLPPGRDVDWYKVGRPGSLRVMARQLGREDDYHTLYRSLSYSTHGVGIRRHATIQESVLTIEPIRGPEAFKSTFTLAVSLAFRSYTRVLEVYRANDLENFRRIYKDRWRDAFLRIPNVEVVTEQSNA